MRRVMQYERYGATSNTASYGGVAKDVTVVVCKSIAGACERVVLWGYHSPGLLCLTTTLTPPHPNPKAIIIVDTQ